MKLIRTLPRYRCDYCKHTGIKRTMVVHEKVCWRNPDRHCNLCNDKGWYDDGDGFIVNKIPCYFCSQFDATKSPPLEEQAAITAPAK